MAAIHVLEAGGLNLYRVVVHSATPQGNNSAGVAWSAALVGSGRATTVMAEGSGPGQISTEEKALIESGAVIEGVFMWGDNPSWNNTQRLADLDLRAGQLTAELQARYAAELKFYGATRP